MPNFDTGARMVRLSGGPINFYSNTTMTNAYVAQALGGTVNTIVIANDSTTDTVRVSYDGSTLSAGLLPSESIEMNIQGITSIYLRGVAGGGACRVWGW
jgi:hypothetical protein